MSGPSGNPIIVSIRGRCCHLVGQGASQGAADRLKLRALRTPASRARGSLSSAGGTTMAGYRLREKKRRTKLWVALILLTVAMFALSAWLAGPSPPKRIRLATGEPEGYY